MIWVVLATVAVLLAVVHIALSEPPRTRARVVEALLLYFFVIPIGMGGFMGFLGHIARARAVAASIGWPAGNPFQSEVAMANLAFGILGILCVRNRGSFWTATAIGWSIFFFGDGCIHLHQIWTGQRFAPGNAGGILYFDLVMPLLITGLLAARCATKNST